MNYSSLNIAVAKICGNKDFADHDELFPTAIQLAYLAANGTEYLSEHINQSFYFSTTEEDAEEDNAWFKSRVMQIVGVDKWDDVVGKLVLIRLENGWVRAIGSIAERYGYVTDRDTEWFEPDAERKCNKRKLMEFVPAFIQNVQDGLHAAIEYRYLNGMKEFVVGKFNGYYPDLEVTEQEREGFKAAVMYVLGINEWKDAIGKTVLVLMDRHGVAEAIYHAGKPFYPSDIYAKEQAQKAKLKYQAWYDAHFSGEPNSEDSIFLDIEKVRVKKTDVVEKGAYMLRCSGSLTRFSDYSLLHPLLKQKGGYGHYLVWSTVTVPRYGNSTDIYIKERGYLNGALVRIKQPHPFKKSIDMKYEFPDANNAFKDIKHFMEARRMAFSTHNVKDTINAIQMICEYVLPGDRKLAAEKSSYLRETFAKLFTKEIADEVSNDKLVDIGKTIAILFSGSEHQQMQEELMSRVLTPEAG